MLELVKWLKEHGASPLCALRLATKAEGACVCAVRDFTGVRTTCDELARKAWKKGTP